MPLDPFATGSPRLGSERGAALSEQRKVGRKVGWRRPELAIVTAAVTFPPTRNHHVLEFKPGDKVSIAYLEGETR